MNNRLWIPESEENPNEWNGIYVRPKKQQENRQPEEESTNFADSGPENRKKDMQALYGLHYNTHTMPKDKKQEMYQSMQSTNEQVRQRKEKIKNEFLCDKSLPAVSTRIESSHTWDNMNDEEKKKYLEYIGKNRPHIDSRDVPAGFWDGYLGDVIERIGYGAARRSGSLYSLADFKDMAHMTYNSADAYKRKSNRYKGKTISQQWTDGEYADMLGNIGLNLAEDAPDLLFALGGPVGLGLLTVSSVIGNYDRLNRNEATKNMSEGKKILHAVTLAAYELLIDRLGNKYLNLIPQPFKTGIEKGAEEIGQDIIKETTGFSDVEEK